MSQVGEVNSNRRTAASAAESNASISGSSVIHYSSKALMRLRDLLPSIDEAIDVAVINERTRASRR